MEECCVCFFAEFSAVSEEPREVRQGTELCLVLQASADTSQFVVERARTAQAQSGAGLGCCDGLFIGPVWYY